MRYPPFKQSFIILGFVHVVVLFLGGAVVAATGDKRNFLRSPNAEIHEDLAEEHQRLLQLCKPNWYGDGQCDMDNCSAQCNWDGGDCAISQCGEYTSTGGGGTSTAPANTGSTTTPQESAADDDGNTDDTSAALDKVACRRAGGKPRLIDDGNCDAFNNIAACKHDGKDCEFNFPSKTNTPPDTTSTTTSTSGGGGGGGDSTGSYWTDLHNTVRKHYHSMYGYSFVHLVWSQDLAQSAQGYADVLASSPCEQYDHDKSNPYGENLAVMWESNDAAGENSRIERVMNAWTYDEEIKNTGLPWQESSGHWSQVIWRATKYVGCGHTYRSSEGCHVYVCRYLAPGNCARPVNGWLPVIMADTDRCEPQCPPTEGCFWS